MDAAVGLQVGRPVELSATDVAAVRLRTCKSEPAGGRVTTPMTSTMSYNGPGDVLTCVNGLVAGQVTLVAESSLAAVALVRLVSVGGDHVVFEGVVLGEFGVTTIAEGVFCGGKNMLCERNNRDNKIHRQFFFQGDNGAAVAPVLMMHLSF